MSTSAPNSGQVEGFPPAILPAFLITGFFIAAAVTLCTWRQFRQATRRTERARAALLALEQGERVAISNTVPKLWDVWVDGVNEKSVLNLVDWGTVMPMSATAYDDDENPMKSGERVNGTPRKVQVACVVSMPSMSRHHKPRQSSDSATSGSEYVIGVAVCETAWQIRELNVGKIKAKQEMTPVECIV